MENNTSNQQTTGGENHPISVSVPSPFKKWAFRLLAMLLVSGCVLGGLEGALRLIGFGDHPYFFQKRVFNNTEYWTENPGFLYRFMPRTQARSPRPVMFPVKKAENVVRIFVLGESAAMGDPEPAFGLAQVLRVLLRDRFPNKEFEVINTALTAINSHLILPLAHECVEKDADFLVIYMGNNEVVGPFGPGTVFGEHSPNLTTLKWGLALKKFRLGQLVDHLATTFATGSSANAWGGMAMFQEKQVSRDDPRLQAVYDHFQSQVRDLVSLPRRSGVPVFISTVPCNLRDSAPFASSVPSSLSDEDKQAWQAHYDQGVQLKKAGLLSEAFLHFQEAESLFSEHADLQFQLGQCLIQIGTPEEAPTHFLLARELDLLRFRADDRLNQVIRDASKGQISAGTHFLDAVQVFAEQSEYGLPGSDLFWDHVHLKFLGNYLLAKLYAENVATVLAMQNGGGTKQAVAWLGAEQCARRMGLTRWGQYQMTSTMFSRLNVPPFTGQSNRAEVNTVMAEEIRLLRMEPDQEKLKAMSDLYLATIQNDPGNWLLYDQHARFLKAVGDRENAVIQWKKVIELVPHHFMARYELGTLLKTSEVTVGLAERYLREAIELRPYIPQVHSELGLCLGRQNKYQDASESFQRAIELNPKDVNVHVNWAIALNLMKKNDEAIHRLEQALTVSTNSVPAHLNMARFLAPGKDWGRVRHHLNQVLRLDPDNAEAIEALGKVEAMTPGSASQ
ncbi:MAG: tetratricopeptide repeat protein [Verrucomicrobiota bacterium]